MLFFNEAPADFVVCNHRNQEVTSLVSGGNINYGYIIPRERFAVVLLCLQIKIQKRQRMIYCSGYINFCFYLFPLDFARVLNGNCIQGKYILNCCFWKTGSMFTVEPSGTLRSRSGHKSKSVEEISQLAVVSFVFVLVFFKKPSRPFFICN